jgi:hypothetical protein
MAESCPYITGKLRTCGGELRLTMEKLLDPDEDQIIGLDTAYRKQYFTCTRCGKKLKRYFMWQERQHYDT